MNKDEMNYLKRDNKELYIRIIATRHRAFNAKKKIMYSLTVISFVMVSCINCIQPNKYSKFGIIFLGLFMIGYCLSAYITEIINYLEARKRVKDLEQLANETTEIK